MIFLKFFLQNHSHEGHNMEWFEINWIQNRTILARIGPETSYAFFVEIYSKEFFKILHNDSALQVNHVDNGE